MNRKQMKTIKKLYAVLTMVLISFMLAALYALIFNFFTVAKADTKKVGEGNFVMAVSYTESYKDLHYVANFNTCEQAQAYYDSNCIGAMIMMCQLEEYLYMPITHETQNEFSSFDFEIAEGRSCGFVGVDPKFTGVE